MSQSRELAETSQPNPHFPSLTLELSKFGRILLHLPSANANSLAGNSISRAQVASINYWRRLAATVREEAPPRLAGAAAEAAADELSGKEEEEESGKVV